MRKFKLIKEYPGSPKLGTIHSDENKYREWQGYDDYEKYTEFWEEITNIYYLVFTKEETSFNAWEPIRVEICSTTDTNENRKFFKTKEEAEVFIIHNKPCLKFIEVVNAIKELKLRNEREVELLDNIYNLLKSSI